MVKFIHTSDWQLGMTRWFLEGDGAEAQSRFDEDRLVAIDRIGALAQREGAEFIVVAGDVFDSNTLPERVFQRALDRIAKLPVPVYLLPGNHDALDASSIYNRAAFQKMEDEDVFVIRDSEPIIVRDGVEIVGVPVRGKYSAEDVVGQVVSDLQPTAGARIVVAHGQVEGFGQDAGATIDLEEIRRAASRGAVDFVALGDSHSTAQLDPEGRVWFSGAHETTDYDDKERDSGNALLVAIEPRHTSEASSKLNVAVTQRRVGKWRFHAVTKEVTSFDDVEDFFAHLDSIPEKTTTAVKYSLRGTVSLTEMSEFERRLATQESRFAALYRRKSGSDLTVVAEVDDIDKLGLSGYPLQAAHQLSALSQGNDAEGMSIAEEQRQAATDALRLLARLVGEKE
nr:metallophosphoesterase [Corynebacterium lactis]